MLSPSIAVLVLLTAPAQEEPSGSIYAEPACSWINPTLSVVGILQQERAPLGGAWWMRRLESESPNEAISLFQNPEDLLLVDGSGNPQTDFSLHITSAALALTIPEGALPGSNYLLRKNDSENQSTLLQVTTDAVAPSDFSLINLSAENPQSPEECYSECYEPGFDLPWALAVDLVFEGSPIVADIWFDAASLGSEFSLLEDRLIDSQYLLEGSHRLVVSSYFEGETSMNVHVELRSPDTLEILHQDTLLLDPVPTVPFEPPEEDRIDCDEYEMYYQDEAFVGDCYCSGGQLPFSLLAAWFLVWSLAALGPRWARRRKHA